MHEAVSPIAVGDKAPSCFGVSPGRIFYSFEEQYGRPVLLVLIGAQAQAVAKPVVNDLLASLGAFNARGTNVYFIVDDNPAFVLGAEVSSFAIRTMDCGSFLTRCGVGGSDAMVLLLDRNLRVAWQSPPRTDIVEMCLACLDRLPAEAGRDVATPAPVIVLPNLVSAELCRELIALFEASPSIDGAVARIDAAGNRCSVVDHSKKQRRDMLIEPGTGLHRTLRHALLGRCAPEIGRAFQVGVGYTDRILIARYDDTGGWFRRHRDNVADNVAFRQFALSLNLNTGDYDGGQLLFPEYNDHRYAPPAGGGVIFSASVLHEAAPVTRGSRYVLLTFFHDEAAEVRRQAQQSQ